jgi:nucleoside phosphorylase
MLVAAALVAGGPALVEAKPGARHPLCRAAAKRRSAPYVVILSAFPAELASLVAVTTIEKTIEVAGKPYYVGRLDGVHVVLGLMGIGLINAATTGDAVVSNLDVAGVIVSGVAGSNQRIGDVVLPDDWLDRAAGDVHATNVAMLALARRIAPTLPALERCTPVPPADPTAPLVCMGFDPTLVIGGHGVSADPYNGPAPCGADTDEILGCALPKAAGLVTAAAATTSPQIEDMETAAIARITAGKNLPFLGVRAVSDGAGDPQGDRPIPFLQFFDYYRLAARNAGTVTRAVVAELGRLAHARSGRRACHLLARQRWDDAAAQLAK